MESYEFIKIRGIDSTIPEDTDPGSFECLQGTSLALDEGSSFNMVLQPSDSEILQELWDSQDSVIKEQSLYLEELIEFLAERRATIPEQDSIWETALEELIEFLGGELVYWLVYAKTKSKAWSELAGATTELAIGLGISYLKKAYEKSKVRFSALIEANNALLLLDANRGNYELRDTVLKTHTEIIENLQRHIAQIESALLEATNSEGKDVVAALKDMAINMEALKYNDEEIDFGNVRLHLRSKMIDTT